VQQVFDVSVNGLCRVVGPQGVAKIALWIAIDQKYFELSGPGVAKIEGSRGFAHPSFKIVNGNGISHS
jgi:hypothetical protein